MLDVVFKMDWWMAIKMRKYQYWLSQNIMIVLLFSNQLNKISLKA